MSAKYAVRMFVLTFLAAAFACCGSVAGAQSATTLAQQPRISIEQTSLISAEDPRTPHVESWLAQNPQDSRNLIAVANAMPGHIHSETALYYTKDAGKTWHRSGLAGGGNYFQGTDPSLTFAPDGTGYYVNEDNEILNFFRSTNGGETWERLSPLAGVDHPVVMADNSDSKYRDRIYVAATGYTFTAQGEQGSNLVFAYSDDGGVTFHERAFQLQQKGPDNRMAWVSITDVTIRPDGSVVLIYSIDVQAEEGKLPTSVEFWVITSSNGGRTFTEPHRITSAAAPSDDARALKAAYFAKLAVDNSSGPHRGRLYLAYLDLVDGWLRTKVIHSDDLGQTWEEPVEAGPNPTHTDQSIPGIAVSQEGIVGVSWYDWRKDPKNECFQGYFASSVDGAITFLPAISLQGSQTCPKAPGNEVLHGAYSRLDGGKHVYSVQTAADRFSNGGETQGMAGLDHGRFLLAWVNGESGVMQLESTVLRVNAPPLGRDLTDRLKVNVGQPKWDVAAHKMSVPVSITNVSRIPMQGPFYLDLLRFGSIFGELRASGTKNGLSTAGATWELDASPGKSVLAPGATSQQITLNFEISDRPPGPPKFGEVQLDMIFRVFDTYKK